METLRRPDECCRFAASPVNAGRDFTSAARGQAASTRRNAVFLAFFLLSAGTALSEADVRKPNVALTLADDMGYESISANRRTSYQTPNIDGMARDCMR